jgi:hypothetical protein
MSSMPKLRNLGKYGVITDLDPYDLPTEAFSMAVNARFRNNRLQRSPVFRNIINLGTTNPRFIATNLENSGTDLIMFGYENGRVFNFSNATETDYSVSGYTNSVSEAAWTDCHLADLFYINRADRLPWVLLSGGSSLTALANWPSGLTCQLLKSYGGALVALNCTLSGTVNQTMIRTSSFALAESVPASWDFTSPSTNATQNILAEMEGPITDANPFGNALAIYGYEQTWMMVADGSTAIYSYVKLPFKKGAINANCSIEIGGKHYVFGPDDIWKHDGVSAVSICEGQTRDFIFGGLNTSKINRCFVCHNPRLNQLSFCYVSGDAYTGFTGAPDGCNRAAVFDYMTNTWTFDDLPLVYYGARANINVTATYASTTALYSTIGGSYQDFDGSTNLALCFVGDTNSTFGLTNSLYAFDPYGPGSQVTAAVDTNATLGMSVYRDGVDLDELDIDLQGYKQVDYIIPQGRLDANVASLPVFYFGAADDFNETPVFSGGMTYNGADLYKLDFGQAGRYLSYKIIFNDYHYISLSGFDLALQVTGDR